MFRSGLLMLALLGASVCAFTGGAVVQHRGGGLLRAASPVVPCRTRQCVAIGNLGRNEFDLVVWTPFPRRLDAEGHDGREFHRRPNRYTSRDWLRIFLNTPSSIVLRRIQQPILFSTMLTAAVTLLYRMVPTLPAFSYKPHSLVGSALSLLLVFRTNAAYTRFWEGRQRWQMLSDHVRSLARLVMIYETQVGHKRREQVARLLCAFPIVLKQYLRGYTLADSGVEKLLSETDRESLLRVRNGPLHVCNLLGKTLSAVPDTPESVEPHISFSARERLAMLGKVAALSDCIGACERIVQTPVPLHYARHTSRLATIFVNTLPFVLCKEMGLLAIPTMAVVVWALFGIQEIGLIIEEPFREVIKLDSICSTIQRDVYQTLDAGDEAHGAPRHEWQHERHPDEKSTPAQPQPDRTSPLPVRATRGGGFDC